MSRRARLAAGWAACVALALLARLAPPHGGRGAPYAQFLGRFHPVIVHLPIALLLLVPVLDLAGRAPARAGLRAASTFVLGLASAAAILAAFDGWLLARTGGYQGHTVTLHLWFGVALTFACQLAASLRAERGLRNEASPSARSVADWGGPLAGMSAGSAAAVGSLPAKPAPGPNAGYLPALIAALVLLLITSHLGGTLTHGEGYLTKELPLQWRLALHLTSRPAPKPPGSVLAQANGKPAAPSTFYAAKVAPILQRSCVSCHNANKEKGGLLMDTYANLMEGGEDGPVVAPWLPQESDLIRRITLPPSDDDFMPNNGRNLLTPAEIRTLEDWVAAGASDRQPVTPARFPPPQ